VAAATQTPGTATTTSPSSTQAAVTAAPTPAATTPTVTPAGTVAAAATRSPAPGLSGAVDLKSVIPADIAGNRMIIEIGTPDSFLGLWNDPKRAQDLLRSLGKSVSDVSIANSYGDVVYPKVMYISAYRVAGADPDALLHGIVNEYLRMVPDFAATPTVIGGKNTIVLLQPNAPTYARQIFYGFGDTVFLISANPVEWATEALTRLP
jgi:hypothetical protein